MDPKDFPNKRFLETLDAKIAELRQTQDVKGLIDWWNANTVYQRKNQVMAKYVIAPLVVDGEINDEEWKHLVGYPGSGG